MIWLVMIFMGNIESVFDTPMPNRAHGVDIDTVHDCQRWVDAHLKPPLPGIEFKCIESETKPEVGPVEKQDVAPW